MNFNLFSLILLSSGLLVAGISAVIIKQSKGVIQWFAITMMLVAIWALGYGLELSSLRLEDMLLWIKLEYIGISFAPATWLWFCLQYVGFERWNKTKVFYSIFLVPILTFTLVLTNEWHHFHYANTSLDLETASFPLLVIKAGPWYFVHVGYFYLALLLGNLLLFSRFKDKDAFFRKQTYLLISAGTIPWLINMTYMLGLGPFKHIDLTPFAFLFLYIIVGIALIKFRLFNIRPIARDKIFNALDKGVLVFDSQKQVIDYNPFMASILRYPKKSLVGIKLNRLFEDKPIIEDAFDSQKTQKIELEFEYNGPQKIYGVNFTPIFDSKENFNGCIIMFDDITEEKEISERLSKQTEELKNLNSLKDKLFTIISHDLKDPIFGIRELVKMTNEGLISQEEFFELMPEISKNMDSVSILLENLLAWTSAQMKGEFIQKKVFDIGPLIDQQEALFKKFAKDKNIVLKTEKDGNLEVFADKNMIDLIIRNLLSNAVKFCGQGDQILLSATEQLDTVSIQVIDTGMGIPEENLKKLNLGESFTTRGKNKETGTGLGLILVKDYIIKNGGTLHIKSELNKGSVFSFNLPKSAH